VRFPAGAAKPVCWSHASPHPASKAGRSRSLEKQRLSFAISPLDAKNARQAAQRLDAYAPDVRVVFYHGFPIEQSKAAAAGTPSLSIQAAISVLGSPIVKPNCCGSSRLS